jgi:hypothetical protein
MVHPSLLASQFCLITKYNEKVIVAGIKPGKTYHGQNLFYDYCCGYLVQQKAHEKVEQNPYLVGYSKG